MRATGETLSKPLLSICIPTYNRADVLELLLGDLEVECAAYLDQIEVVVSDNASPDRTEAVVRNSALPVVYSRNSENIGFAGNLLNATAKLASGEYVWIVGDDDLILPGGVARVIQSLLAAPDVDYHYINFGWINYQFRMRVGQADAAVGGDLQCDVQEWRLLPRLEDLAFLPAKNPSVLFSCIFSFVARRHFFVKALDWLRPSRSLDGSSTLIDDCFPHAMITLPNLVGRPIAYIGRPCVLQSVGGWEWGEYANKNMIFGIHQFFCWLEESTSIAKDGMDRLWSSYYDMAGRLFARMQCAPSDNKGADIVLQQAIPSCSSNPIFWAAFMDEAKACIETNYEAEFLAKMTRHYAMLKPGARIGVWGWRGRGYQFLRAIPDLAENIVWIGDRDSVLHGDRAKPLELSISAPISMMSADLDCLVVAVHRKFVTEIVDETASLVGRGIHIISMPGDVSS